MLPHGLPRGAEARGPRRTALGLRSQPRAREAGVPGVPAQQPEDWQPPPPSLPPRHGLQAARAAARNVAGAASGPGTSSRDDLRPAHSLPCATRSPAGNAGAPAIRDTRAIVLDPRPRQFPSERRPSPRVRRRAAGPDGWPARRGSSQTPVRCSEGRRRWWAEAVGGEAIALLSPKSKVLRVVSGTRS